MRPVFVLLVAAALSSADLAMALAEESAKKEPEWKRYSVIIGNNNTLARGRASLRYADDDAAKYYRLLAPISTKVYLLTTFDLDTQMVHPELVEIAEEPSSDAIRRSFDEIELALFETHGRAEIFFIFSGHGGVGDDGVGYVETSHGRFTRHDLTAFIKRFQHARVHIILDSCKSYFMAFARGEGEATEKTRAELEVAHFLEEETRSLFPNVGFLMSTSGGHDAHEWSEIRAGVFSHEVVSALLGAADINADGRVQYGEVAAFFESANVSLESAGVDLDVSVRPPGRDINTTLLDLRSYGLPIVHFPSEWTGNFRVRDRRNTVWSEFHKAAGVQLNIALIGEHPFYLARRYEHARIDGSGDRWVHADTLVFNPTDRPRGPIADAFEERLFETPFGWDFYQGFIASRGWPAVLRNEKTRLAPLSIETSTSRVLSIGVQLMRPGFGLSGLEHGVIVAWRKTWFRGFSTRMGGGYYNRFGEARGESYHLHHVELRVGAGLEHPLGPFGVGIHLEGGMGTVWKFGEESDGRDDYVPFGELTASVGTGELLAPLEIALHVGARFQSTSTASAWFHEVAPVGRAEVRF